MAQLKEMNRTSTGLEDKDVLLDLENEKDFFASWKSITVGETNKFDFDLPPASKGKKKSYDFDQADKDFSLNGDFGTSSNIDIPDLDISPPLKKEVSNEKTKESSTRSSERKADSFTFALILMSKFVTA